MQKLEITREQYEQWKGQPEVHVDMECHYYLVLNGQVKTKRKSPKNKRSPNDMISLKEGWEKRGVGSDRQVEAVKAVAGTLKHGPLPSINLSRVVAKSLNTGTDNAAHFVTQLIKHGILEVTSA